MEAQSSKFIKLASDTVFAGDRLQGEVVITLLEKPRKYKAIHVLISGQAETEWKEREKKEVNGASKKTTETYKGKKLYFEQMLPLIGPLTNYEFTRGTHTFPFAYQLSEHLPPSIRGTHGNCTYTVKAILDRPWRPNETIKKEFTVATRHFYPMAMLAPVYEHTTEELWSLPFKTSPFKLNVEVAQQAFRVGEGIPVSVHLEHESGITIHELKFQLRQVVSFYSQHPQRKCKQEQTKVLDIRCKVMDARKVGKFQRVLQIPHVPVTYLTHSELAAIAYEVRVEVKLGGLNKNPVLTIPVVIGTGHQGEVNLNATNPSIGFESLSLMSPRSNMSQMSSISGSSAPLSHSLLETSTASVSSAGAASAPSIEAATAPPAYHEVVSPPMTMTKH